MKKFRIVLLTLVLFFSCLISFMPSSNILNVYASNIQIDGAYTSVLADLQKDEKINTDNYPVNMEDYSLQVIHIAESVDNDLFVYVYQPCSPNEDLKATTIKFSTGIEQNLSYKVYNLTLLNSQGVFYKYRVNDFVVKKDMTRYYDISAIHRKWNSKYDEEASGNNTISQVVFEVGKQYTFKSTTNGIEVNCQDIELITITDKYVGFVRYYGDSGGFIFDWKYKDSHFVAFKADRDIDRLMEADVFFQTQSKHESHAMLDVGLPIQTSFDFGSIEDHYSTLNYTDKVKYEEGAWFWKHKYTWDRIQTAQQFLASEDRSNMYNGVVFNQETQHKMTDEGISNIQGMDWVLRFYESDYTEDGDVSIQLEPQNIWSTLVSNVSILRLAFETDGVYYNLGVVDNFQTGDGNPDNYIQQNLELTDTFKVILAILLLIVLLVVLNPILPVIFKVIGWIITAPFKFIGWLFNLGKGSKTKTRKRK